MLLYNQFDRISLRHADRVLTVCRPLAEQLKARGVSQNRIHVQHIPIRPFNTTPEDAAALRRELKIDPAAKIILTLGRLSYEKAQADLITAFAQLRDGNGNEGLHLVLVGAGTELPRLEKRAKQLGVEKRVTFAGHRDDAYRFYGIACAFALSSYAEGTPNVILESMAAGVPVVATSVGGVPELATHGRTALLVPPARPLALADALQRLLDSPALRNQLALAAREVVESHPPQLFFQNMRGIFVDGANSWRNSSH
jgi:glycosyltransferase involved in cell wall biosynthesis